MLKDYDLLEKKKKCIQELLWVKFCFVLKDARVILKTISVANLNNS